MARAGAVVLGSITLMVGIFVLFIVTWMAGVFVVPIYDEAMANSAVQSLGWDTSIATTVPLGIELALPLIGVVLVIWAIFVSLQDDAFFGGGGRMR